MAALGCLRDLTVLTITPDILRASEIANRIWPFLVLVLFIRATLSIITRPNYYVLGLFIFSALGLLSGNSPLDIVTDGTVMILPAIFWRQLQLKGLNEPKAFGKFCESYLTLNLMGIFFITFPSLVVGVLIPGAGSVSMDWNFATPVLLSRVFSSAILGDSMLYLGLFGIVAGLSLVNKAAIGNIALAAAAMTRGRVVLIVFGILVLSLIVLALLPFLLQTKASTKLMMLLTQTNLSQLFSLKVVSLVLNPTIIFHVMDVSSAERIFEFLEAIRKISTGWFHIIFGNGLGAGVDLSGSGDNGVLAAHSGDTEDVRVVHLALTWFLLKSGVVGLTSYIVLAFIGIWQAIASICSGMIYREHRWLWLTNISFLLVLFSIQVGISLSLKTPVFAISLMGVFLAWKLRKQAQRRGPYRPPAETVG